MNAYAFYRLPHANYYTCIEQTVGSPLRFDSLTQLNGQSGFVLAPFQMTADVPVWLIQPDKVETRMLPTNKELPADRQTIHDNPSAYSYTYAIDFANFHAQLESNRFSKIVLSRTQDYTEPVSKSPDQLFFDACSRYPRLFVSLVSLPDGECWLAATPEILLEGVGEKWRTIALAGTMQLHGEQLKGEGETIRWSTKNIQEQRYVATYIASCLERFSLPFKEEGPRTVRAANLVHLRSDFSFILHNKGTRIGELLQALHPTPAVCGLPKRETFDFIVRHEHTPRRYYSGFMGPLNMCDETHLYVSLRCMSIHQDVYRLYAGGGLLKDSQLEQEWQETEAKMQIMKNLLINHSHVQQ